MSIDGQNDVDGLKRAGAAVAEARDTMGAHVAPGVTVGLCAPRDGSIGAQFEHTMIVTRGAPIIVT